MVVDGYRGDMVRSALTSEFPAEWFQFVRNEAWDTTGNAYSLHLAGRAAGLDGREPGEFFLLDSDIAFDSEVLDRLLAAPAPNRLALRTHGTIGAEEMKVRVDDRGLIVDISKELPPAEAAGESVGLEIFGAAAATRLFQVLAARVAAGVGRTEFYEESFRELIRECLPLHPVDLGDLRCLEIDTPDDLARAEQLFGPPT